MNKLLIPLLLLTSCTWSAGDKIAASVFWAGRFADMGTTAVAINKGYEEVGPVMGNFGEDSTEYLVANTIGSLVLFGVGALFPSGPARQGFYYVTGIPSFAIAIKNYSEID